MGNIPGIDHTRAVRAFQRAGFWISRQSKHVIMTDGTRIITIPRSNPINGYTLAAVVRDAGLTEKEFRDLL